MKGRGLYVWMVLAGLAMLAGLFLTIFPIHFPGEWTLGRFKPTTPSEQTWERVHFVLQQVLLYGGGLALGILASMAENRRSEQAVRESLERLAE